jgi:crotonobetainyl-CoA:carnitine CoA-transferase CaiB-like acyl-CoA transferase
MSQSPLSHIRVLDLSRIMAGPWASQIFADLGADVIKIERQGRGDDTRSWGPPFLKDRDGNDTTDAGYFLAVNRGKRSITLDIATPEGQRIVRELVRHCDIVIENFKVDTLDRYGLGYDDLKAIKPDIIYCSVTGFGQTGPRRDQPAYDFMIQAMGGLMSVTGEPDGAPGGGPEKVGVPIVDIMTGMYAAIATLGALVSRGVTGKGDHVDIAMLDVQVGFLANQAMNYLVSGKPPVRAGNAHPNIQPQDVFPCRDGHLVLVVGNDGQFAKFCEVIGQKQLAFDPRFAANADRVRNRALLSDIIRTAFAEADMADWLTRLDAAGVPCGPINTIPAVLADEQVQHRGMKMRMDHPLAGDIDLIASPMLFRNAQLRRDRHPPLLGEHTEEILAEFSIQAPTDTGGSPHS